MTPEELFSGNVGLAYVWAGRKASRCPTGVHRDELIGPALEGMWQAAHRFNPDLGYTFASFAVRRCFGSMQDYLRSLDIRMRRVAKDGYPEMLPLDSLAFDLEDRRAPQPFEVVASAELAVYVREAVDQLPVRHRWIVRQVFFEGRTQASLADEMRLSAGRVSQILSRALELLHEELCLKV